MIKNPVARITAGIILIISVIAILFGPVLGMANLPPESLTFLGTITGIAGTFLFLGGKSDAAPTG